MAAMQDWGLVPQDEEVPEANLIGDVHPPGRRQQLQRFALRVAALGVVCVLSVYAVVWQSIRVSSNVEVKAEGVQEKVALGALDVHLDDMDGLHPEEATKKESLRKKFLIEGDMNVLVLDHFSSSDSNHHSLGPNLRPEECKEQAELLFDEVVTKTHVENEFIAKAEREAFGQRFAEAMMSRCKELKSEKAWIEVSGQEFEKQKPIMTQALADHLNKAELGYKVEMNDWLRDLTASSAQSLLGLLEAPVGQESVYNHEIKLNSSVQLPMNFQTHQKWPQCAGAITRIHNQGHCGSCWAFSGLGVADARVCIGTGGGWESHQDVFSRLEVTSCALSMFGGGNDGCRGGWPHWAWGMLSRTGVVSQSCIPYYIQGAGSEHFTQHRTAPPCENHCQGGYFKSMNQDSLFVNGMDRFNWMRMVHNHNEMHGLIMMSLYTQGPISYTFQVRPQFYSYKSGIWATCAMTDYGNHAVMAIGYGVWNGVPYYVSSNSWGTSWGYGGHFFIHSYCVSDALIPGPIRGIKLHPVDYVHPGYPPDRYNRNWPWPRASVSECPFDNNGCVFVERDDYRTCTSDQLNGKRVKVVEFSTEAGYDVLTVNGVRFSGEQEEVVGLEGLVVGAEGLNFEVDSSGEGSGFKLCPA